MRRHIASFFKFLPLLLVVGVVLFATPLVHAQTSSTLDLGLNSNVSANIGLPTTDIRVIVARIIRVVLGLLGIIALAITVYGGFIFMTAGGNEEQVGKAKKILVNGVIGLILILSSFAITTFVISKLVEATTGTNNGGNNTGGGGGGNPFFVNQFAVTSLPPAMHYCVRNVSLAVVFNQAVDVGTLTGNVVLRDTTDNTVVPGTWKLGVTPNTAIFTPEGSCSPSTGNDCLKSDSPYSLVFTGASSVKSLTKSPELTLDCKLRAGCGPVNFISGSAVDRTPPTISIINPANNSAYASGTNVPVQVTYTDDNGVQNVSLYVSNPSGGAPLLVSSLASSQCKQTDTVTLNWNTAGFGPADYTATAIGMDFAAQSGSDSRTYTIRPNHCYNGVLETNLGETSLGPPECGGECGACGGNACTTQTQCASGVCQNGVCINAMQISGFSPSSGAPGTFVSVVGSYFGTSSGHVYFANKANPSLNTAADWVEAFAPSCSGNFSYWTNNQIIVTVPQGAFSSSPIKVVTAARDNGSGTVVSDVDVTSNHALSNFAVNTVVKPGICSVTPAVGQAGDSVTVSGQNFGMVQGAGDGVFFANQKSALLQSNGWTDKLIGVAVPGIDSGEVGVKIVKGAVESNSVRFSVQPGVGNTYPFIDSVSPNSGARGEYITLTGKNFGSLQGKVLFKTNPTDAGILGSFDFPSDCQKNVWQNNQILVKAPGVGNPGTTYYLQVVTADSKTSVYDTKISFALTSGTPSPGICMISPASGPIPLKTGQSVNVYGEYFLAGSSNAYFWNKSAASPNDIVGRTAAAANPGATETHIAVVPAIDTITGPVSVYRQSDTKISNAVNFAASDCTASGNTCTPGFQCCTGGTQKGFCIASSSICAGQTRFTGYVWRFSTKDIPPNPKVLERCDSAVDAGTALPSPSPSTMWNGANTDASSVCNSALVSVEFTAPLNQATVNANTVKLNQCASFDGKTCTSPTTVAVNPSSYVLATAAQTSGATNQYITIRPTATWQSGAWYQVALGTGITSADAAMPLPLQADKPCGAGTAYCFYFKAGGQDCVLKSIVVTPYTFFTNLLDSPIKEKSGAPLTYHTLGLSDQKCILMDTSNMAWSWSSANTAYADIFGSRVTSTANVSALGNTVAIGVPNDSVVISGAGTYNGITKTGTSPLTIDLSNPSVIDWWPKCDAACTDASVGVKFNVSLSTKNLTNPGTVQFLKCLDENCLSTTDAGSAATLSADGTQIVLKNGGAVSGMYDPVKGLNLINNGFATTRDNTNFPTLSYSPDTYSGSGSFYAASPSYGYYYYTAIASQPMIPVNTSHNYLYEAYVKETLPSTYYNYFYLGFVPYDADGNPLQYASIYKWNGSTDTKLAQDLKPGDTKMYLVDATGWNNVGVYPNDYQSYYHSFAWYGYTNKAGYTYPDYTYTRNLSGNYYVNTSTWDTGGISGNTITLRGPWTGPLITKGTAVRNTYNYAGSQINTYVASLYYYNNPPPSGWIKLGSNITGQYMTGGPGNFAVGTAFVKPFLYANAGTSTASRIYYSNIWLSDLTTAKQDAGLQPNSLYKVVVSASTSNPNTSLSTIWSRAALSSSTSFSKPYNQQFTWRFKTKDTACVPSRVEVEPVSYDAKSINERAIFDAVPYSSPDACSATGQKLNSSGFNWNWSSSDLNVATISAFRNQGLSPSCSQKCLRLGSAIPSTYIPVPSGICGNYVIEAGEDCDAPNAKAGCGLDCRFTGNPDTTTCGNGVVEPNRGEACDPKDPKTQTGCSSSCLNLGSPEKLVDSKNVSSSECGNGMVGSGEDCDTGITGVYNNNKSSMGCSQTCLHNGTQISTQWCANNANNYLNLGFTHDQYVAACASAISRCGDGINAPDETPGCDLGNGQVATWCNSRCLAVATSTSYLGCALGTEGCGKNGMLLGSSLDYASPSYCGDGVVGTGEDPGCETGLIAASTSTFNFGNPWAMAIGVGKGVPVSSPPSQVTNINASTLNAALTSISGTGQYRIMCGYKTDADCAAIGTNYGVGADSCCYVKSSVTKTIPTSPSNNVCRNTVLEIDFKDGIIDQKTLSGNLLIAKGEAGTACAAGEEQITIAGLDVKVSLPWYKNVVLVIKNFFVKLFGGTATAQSVITPNVWCTGSVLGTADVQAMSTSTSKVTIALKKPLDALTPYRMVLKEGIRNTNGVSIGKNGVNNFTYAFNTGNSICEVDTVLVDPSSWYFSRPGATSTLTASASSQNGLVQPIANVYDWNYYWRPNDSAFVNVPAVTIATNTIVSKNQNGEVDVRAFAKLTANTISASTGTVANGASHIVVYLCENPWPPKTDTAGGTSYVPFPYSDSVGNRSGYNLTTNIFDGTSIPASVTTTGAVFPGDGFFNFSTYYCADKGSEGKFDDYAYLRATVQNRAVDLQAYYGNSPFKRFIFSVPSSTDAIGIQVFPNPKHLSPEDWYKSSTTTGGQGFIGNLQTIDISGYKGVTDGDNIYVGALNYAENAQSVYDVMYLFSVNNNASTETHHIFDEIMKNLRFNINLKYNDGYCGLTATNPSFITKCSSDLDCASGEVCSNQTLKLQRNYARLNTLKVIDLAIQAYKINNTSSPSLKIGSYLTGQAVSTWPAWTSFGNELGAAIAVDPVNKLGKAGTCKNNPAQFCVADATCGAGGCVIHDPVTDWSTDSRRFSFACAAESLAFRYIKSASDYQVRSRFEDPGFPINTTNLTTFVNGYNFSAAARFPGVTNWVNMNNPGICNSTNEITTSNQGVCGDGIVNGAFGEQCEPPNSTVYSCNGAVGTGRPCDGSCHWGTASAASGVCTKCGNGKIEAGEVCDDGALNGRYGHCNTSCSGPSALGRCGDGNVSVPYEVCDIGNGRSTSLYGINQVDSCNWDCQSYGPYCGDGVTQSANGETCDNGKNNGTPCIPTYGKSCDYCTAQCRTATVAAPVCGDGVIQTDHEACDNGKALNVPCTAGYNSPCTYCDGVSCQWKTIAATGRCGDKVKQPPQEQCDDPNGNNGVLCIQQYNAICTYCSTKCENVTLQPYAKCGDGSIDNNNRVYFQDFSSSNVGSEWSKKVIQTSGAEKYLADSPYGFGPGKVTLSLTKLPTHSSVIVQYDLYILNSWDQPDSIALDADGTRITRTSFTVWSNQKQSYPAEYSSGAINNYNTGAYMIGHLWGAVNPLYPSWPLDVTYHITKVFPHTSANLTLDFIGLEDQAKEDEGWGLDNVYVGVSRDSVIDNDEICDKGTANGQACQTQYHQGCVTCTKNGTTNGCKESVTQAPFCGDNIIDTGYEQCDGTAMPNGGVACSATRTGDCYKCSSDCKATYLPPIPCTEAQCTSWSNQCIGNQQSCSSISTACQVAPAPKVCTPCKYSCTSWSCNISSSLDSCTAQDAGSPSGCVGTPPALSSYAKTCPVCTGGWICPSAYFLSSCTVNGTTCQPPIRGSVPADCAGGTPTQNCLYTPPPPAPACIYPYSAWTKCIDGSQSRTLLGPGTPAGCVGTPILDQSCGGVCAKPCGAYQWCACGVCQALGTSCK